MKNIEKASLKKLCEEDHLFFTRYFFKNRQGVRFRINWHHFLVADKIQQVMDGKIKNLVINIPPGSSKTELVVINLIARSLALNPNCRFLHVSSSEILASLNSQTAREILQSDEFQEFWPMKIADDSRAKKRWNVENEEGRTLGGVYAAPLGGQITGFRAGHMVDGWHGCILIDDPIKADDAFSPVAVASANRALASTVDSRRANPDVPIIIIMQRICETDCTAFVETGALGTDWEFLKIPAIVTEEYLAGLPEKCKKFIDRTVPAVNGEMSYWPYKENLERLLAMRAGIGENSDGVKIGKHVFNAQYMQNPVALGGNIIRGEKFTRYVTPPNILYRKIFADTAMKTGERNDYSVFQEWGYTKNGVVLLSQMRGKWEAPELRQRAIDFWNSCRSKRMGSLREMIVEDKASGTGLIQELKRAQRIPIRGIERNKDKLTRVMDVLSYIDSGLVHIPEEGDWVLNFVRECEAFTADDSHAHDDQIDPMCDAIMDMLQPKSRGFFG